MKTKITLLVALMLMLMLWASPAMAIELDELPEFEYEIQPFEMIADEPKPEKQGFWANRDPWTKKDTYWQLGFTAIQVLDFYQTNQNIENGGTEYSSFVVPFIGEHPTTQQLLNYSICVIIVNTGVAYILPHKWRRIFQMVSTTVNFCEYANSVTGKVIFKF